MTRQGVLDYLARQLEDEEESYDFMIFDCAPNLYNITLNALLYSNYYNKYPFVINDCESIPERSDLVIPLGKISSKNPHLANLEIPTQRCSRARPCGHQNLHKRGCRHQNRWQAVDTSDGVD